jgi:hypothetical protein
MTFTVNFKRCAILLGTCRSVVPAPAPTKRQMSVAWPGLSPPQASVLHPLPRFLISAFKFPTLSFFNTLQPHSNANKKVIDNQCTFVPISFVYPDSNPCLPLLHHVPVSHFHFLFSPNSFLHTSLAAPHPINPIESHPYKIHRGDGACLIVTCFSGYDLLSFLIVNSLLPYFVTSNSERCSYVCPKSL